MTRKIYNLKSSSKISNLLLTFFTTTITLLLANLVLINYYSPNKDSKNSVEFVQANLRLHSTLGYLWDENLKISNTPRWQDQDKSNLYTDEDGFRNHPEAIELKNNGKKIDIIGLGDSFIHDASNVLFEYFKTKNMFYYNYGMHRHSPPQYNIILKDYVVRKKPDWVIYGIYENDFIEAKDFINWQKSGVDWFEYHSGVWFGAPKSFTWYERFMANSLKGFYFLYLSTVKKVDKNPAGLKENPKLIARYINEAYTISVQNNINFLVILIPGKLTVTNKISRESFFYDRLLNNMKEMPVNVIDLRTVFMNEKTPDSLYYKVDPHWNRKGILLASDVIISQIKDIK